MLRGEALAAAAWREIALGLGAACWMSRPSGQEESLRVRGACVAARPVARLAENVFVRVSTAGVSSAVSEIDKAKHTLATRGLGGGEVRARRTYFTNIGLLRRVVGPSHGEDGP